MSNQMVVPGKLTVHEAWRRIAIKDDREEFFFLGGRPVVGEDLKYILTYIPGSRLVSSDPGRLQWLLSIEDVPVEQGEDAGLGVLCLPDEVQLTCTRLGVLLPPDEKNREQTLWLADYLRLVDLIPVVLWVGNMSALRRVWGEGIGKVASIVGEREPEPSDYPLPAVPPIKRPQQKMSLDFMRPEHVANVEDQGYAE